MLEGDWGSLPGPRVASVRLSETHGVSPALGSGDTMERSEVRDKGITMGADASK